MSAIKIESQRVILTEGDAKELAPDAKVVAGMHGFVIMVPSDESNEWFLDLLWRITMLYAGRPSWLRSRAKMGRMIEAVMSKETRNPKSTRRPVRKSERTDRARRDRLTLSNAPAGPARSPKSKLHKTIESSPSPKGGRKAKSPRR